MVTPNENRLFRPTITIPDNTHGVEAGDYDSWQFAQLLRDSTRMPPRLEFLACMIEA